jgi:hypothetical protein
VSVSRVTLPAGRVTTSVVRSRLTFTFTPRMFVSGLVQVNAENHRASTNVRLRWEYRPGSELYVVYSDERDTAPVAIAQPRSRGVAVKMHRLLRY